MCFPAWFGFDLFCCLVCVRDLCAFVVELVLLWLCWCFRVGLFSYLLVCFGGLLFCWLRLLLVGWLICLWVAVCTCCLCVWFALCCDDLFVWLNVFAFDLVLSVSLGLLVLLLTLGLMVLDLFVCSGCGFRILAVTLFVCVWLCCWNFASGFGLFVVWFDWF